MSQIATDLALAELVDRSIEEWGTAAFWNVRTDLPLPRRARVAIDQLRKHGGMKGWRRADEIARLLEMEDGSTWR